MRHRIVDLYVMIEKLHHEICMAAELERSMVDRVMAEVYRHRQRESEEVPTVRRDSAREVEQVAEAVGVSPDVVERIAMAEVAWMLRRGYLVDAAGAG
jgi:hypothetical protein